MAFVTTDLPFSIHSPAINGSDQTETGSLWQRPVPRVVGGAAVNPPFRYPFMVGILVSWKVANLRDAHTCGGSLIAPEYVLTAAHCIHPHRLPSYYTAIIHANDLSGALTHRCTQLIQVRSVNRHPGYMSTTDQNDIAVLRLSATPRCAAEMQAAGSLVRVDSSSPLSVAATGIMATAIGWGSLTLGGAYPHLLMGVTVPIQSTAACMLQHGTTWMRPGMLCAGFTAGGADTCQGDSGGPLFVTRPGGGWTVVGVTSWGFGCAAPSAFAVYTSVSFFSDWIKTMVPSLLVAPPPPLPPPMPIPPRPPPRLPPQALSIPLPATSLPISPSLPLAPCAASASLPSSCGPLSASQARLQCSCAYVWQSGCDEPVGVCLHCE